MRPLLFILGLVFAVTVLIANVNAIKCCVQNPDEPLKKVDCNERAEETKFNNLLTAWGLSKTGHPIPEKCGIADVNFAAGVTVTYRDCLYDKMCGDTGIVTVDCKKRCDEDYCNGDCNGAMTSTPHVPLLIAFVGSAIAALGI